MVELWSNHHNILGHWKYHRTKKCIQFTHQTAWALVQWISVSIDCRASKARWHLFLPPCYCTDRWDWNSDSTGLTPSHRTTRHLYSTMHTTRLHVRRCPGRGYWTCIQDAVSVHHLHTAANASVYFANRTSIQDFTVWSNMLQEYSVL